MSIATTCFVLFYRVKIKRMEIITSIHNPTFKLLMKLATNTKVRREAGLALFDGVVLTQDFLTRGLKPEMIVFEETKVDEPAIAKLIATSAGVRQLVLASRLMQKITQVETAPGVITVFRPRILSWNDFIPSQKPIVLLDQVQDPGNLGTILRSSLAFGVGAVFLSGGSVGAFSPKVIRASMGACFALPIYENVDLNSFLTTQNSKYQILATSSHASTTIKQLDFTTKPVAWLFGNEARGVNEKLLACVDQSVAIPQSDAIESLNLSMAVTICLYENYSCI